MRIKRLAIISGAALALAGGLYLGSGAQAGTCTIGGDVGPGVPVILAAQNAGQANPQPAPPKQGQPDQSKPACQKPAGEDKSAQKPAQPKGKAPIVPIIAPDEGC